MLQLLVVPACFIGAGLIGFRLGTPSRVAAGLVAVGSCHLLAFLGSRQALDAVGSAAWIHLVSQVLFLGGFVAIVWLAAVYPDHRAPVALVAAAGALGIGGPLLAAVSGPTPAIVSAEEQLGPVVRLLPESLASVAGAPLALLPLMAVATFAVRRHRAPAPDRAAMRWPIAGTAAVLLAVLAGTLAPASYDDVVTVLFLLTAPVLPLTLAFGPVAHRIGALTGDLAETRQRLAEHARPRPRPAALARLTPREYSVLEAMARGAANPVIARQLHLSLSSVEKHATSIFRKLEVDEGPEVHRRVAAVVAYRDAIEEQARPT